jgi:hypothetical protein
LLTALKPPKKFYKGMDKLQRRFLWARNQEVHGGKCKVSWARICRPLNRSSLGITDLERFSRALRLRWLWLKWKQPEKPWTNTELPVDSVDEALFAAATRVKVRNGQTAMFWTSSWLNGIWPAAVFPALFQHSKRKRRTVADALANDNWIRDNFHNITAPLIVE